MSTSLFRFCSHFFGSLEMCVTTWIVIISSILALLKPYGNFYCLLPKVALDRSNAKQSKVKYFKQCCCFYSQTHVLGWTNIWWSVLCSIIEELNPPGNQSPVAMWVIRCCRPTSTGLIWSVWHSKIGSSYLNIFFLSNQMKYCSFQQINKQLKYGNCVSSVLCEVFWI